jgi:hypothetical protein
LLAVLLFVPVRYNLEAEKSDKLYFDIEASWLFKFAYFRYRLSYKGKKIIFKVFGKTFYKDREAFEDLKQAVEHNNTESSVERHDHIEKSTDVKAKPSDSEQDSANSEEKETKTSNSIKSNKSEKTQNTQQQNRQAFKTTKKQKAEQTDKVIENIAEDISDTIEQGIDEHPIWYRIKQFWDYPDRPKIVRLSITLIKKLIRVIIPDNLSLDIEYGSDNPAHTGFVLAFSSILVLYFGDNIKVRGNFEQEVLKGTLKGSGRLFLIDIVGPLVQFALSKPIIKIIWKYIRKRKEE